jgi:uncharacterized protein
MYYVFVLIICSVLFHIASLFSRDFFIAHFALVGESVFVMPWMFVTSLFMHGDVMHLVFNMVSLLMFGTILEHVIGTKRFLLVYFGAGIFANIIGIWFYPVSLGASGAIFGIIGALAILRHSLIVYVLIMPMPLWILAILYAAIDILGIFYPTNVGNIAHLSGLFFGICCGWYLYTQNVDLRKGTDSYLVKPRSQIVMHRVIDKKNSFFEFNSRKTKNVRK